ARRAAAEKRDARRAQSNLGGTQVDPGAGTVELRLPADAPGQGGLGTWLGTDKWHQARRPGQPHRRGRRWLRVQAGREFFRRRKEVARARSFAARLLGAQSIFAFPL